MSKKALGRGLNALLQTNESEQLPSSSVTYVSVKKLTSNPYQPRKNYDASKLSELTESIKRNGILQPILVEEQKNGKHSIIAGERRFRAAKKAGYSDVPVLIGKYSEEEKIEIALIENIQREDLTPIEEANAYKRLIDEMSLNQDDIALKVGKNRSTVANSLRLLKLPESIQDALGRGVLTSGHARAILMVESTGDQNALFEQITQHHLSVRDAEKIAGEINRGEKIAKPNTQKRRNRNPDIMSLEERLIESFGTKVEIKGGLYRGRIEISYFSQEDLERVLELLSMSETIKP